MGGFFHEAWRRLGTATPPFFIKLQLLGGAIGFLGTGLSIIGFPTGWHFMQELGPVLTGIGGTLVVVLQFVEKAQSILLPGQQLHNDTDGPVNVVVTPVAKDQIVTVPPSSPGTGPVEVIETHTTVGGQPA